MTQEERSAQALRTGPTLTAKQRKLAKETR